MLGSGERHHWYASRRRRGPLWIGWYTIWYAALIVYRTSQRDPYWHGRASSMMPPDQPPFSQPRVARRVMDIYCQIKPSATVSLGDDVVIFIFHGP
jgi:hypothetical protein